MNEADVWLVVGSVMCSVLRCGFAAWIVGILFPLSRDCGAEWAGCVLGTMNRVFFELLVDSYGVGLRGSAMPLMIFGYS